MGRAGVRLLLLQRRQAQLGGALGGIDQDEPVAGKPRERIEHRQQRGVLHDAQVWLQNRFASADLTVADPAVHHHRGPRALRPKGGERLRMAPLRERRLDYQVGRSDNALPASSVDSHLDHGLNSSAARGEVFAW